MARLSRVVLPGYAHYVTQAGVRGLPVFADDADRRGYLTTLSQMCERFGVEVLAWCLMDASVYLLAVPSTPEALARALGEAHRRYTAAFNARQNVRGYLFQGRFGSCPIDEDHQLAAACCIERQPVHAGLVAQPCDHPWSSARFHAGLLEADPLVRDRRLEARAPDWRALVAADPPQMAQLRARASSGRPCGCEQFLAQAEQITGRSLKPKPRGRPRKQPFVGGRARQRP